MGRTRPSRPTNCRGVRATIGVVSADSYADLLERLFGDYEGRHSIPVIEKVVSESRAQLAGQSPPGAQLELLDRLARQRLQDLPPTRPTR